MNTENKQVQVISGPRTNPLYHTVVLNGVLPDERLTPKMARRAARIACGSDDRVTVLDEDHGYGYRLYKNTARKLHLEV